jgi:hypothetical protein
MGSVVGGLFGGADAAEDAAAAQGKAADQSIAFQKDALKQVRGDLAPYRDAGINALYGGPQYDQAAYDKALADFYALPAIGGKTPTTKTKGNDRNRETLPKSQRAGTGYLTLQQYQALPETERIRYEKNSKGQFIRKAPKLEDFKLNPSGGLLDLVTNPEAQKNFITNSPFFDSLAKRSTDTLLSNQAARGKVGSGGTAEALQNSLLLLGSDLLNQSIGQRQNLATMGQNAAAQTGSATQGVSNSISDLYTQKGNAQASGIIGAQNANSQMVGNLASTALSGYALATAPTAAAGSGIASLLALSDIRTKENIKHVGYLYNGLPVYTFKYKGQNDIRMNVMAQDVEKIKPEAVIEHNGLKYVDMEAVWQ